MAVYDVLFVIIELFSLALTVDALQGKNVSKLTAFWRWWVSLSEDFREKGSSLGNIL